MSMRRYRDALLGPRRWRAENPDSQARSAPLAGHRVAELLPDSAGASRSYTFFLTILACVVLMLIGGGVVLFVMLQP